MLEREKQDNINLLKDELDKLNYLLRYGRIPYIFLISNEKYIRDYFENALSEMTDLIIPLKDYDLSCASGWLEDLKRNNLLLLNIIEEEKELEKRATSINSIIKGNALYYCLVLPREIIANTGHGFVMVCDENLILKIINANQSVASCSHMFFLDDTLKDIKEEPKVFSKKKK